MEAFDADGSPALPFLYPAPVPVEYGIPLRLLSADNVLLAETYAKLGGTVNGIFARLDEEPKLFVPSSEDSVTKGLIEEAIRYYLKAARCIEQLGALSRSKAMVASLSGFRRY